MYKSLGGRSHLPLASLVGSVIHSASIGLACVG